VGPEPQPGRKARSTPVNKKARFGGGSAEGCVLVPLGRARRYRRAIEEADADAAMGACAGQEGALIAVELNGVAGAARERVERAQSDGRGVVRQRVIARIVEIRSAR
jgi:hypothetical protein